MIDPPQKLIPSPIDVINAKYSLTFSLREDGSFFLGPNADQKDWCEAVIEFLAEEEIIRVLPSPSEEGYCFEIINFSLGERFGLAFPVDLNHIELRPDYSTANLLELSL